MKDEQASLLAEILDRCRPQRPDRANVLQTLLVVQERLGHVPPNAVGEIAHALQVTEADVAGVLSYYPDLRVRTTGRHLIRVCMGESCLANRSARVLCQLRDRLQVGVGETTPDGRFTLENVYCVGNCAVSPSVIIDGDLYGRMTPAELAAVIEKYK
ncbi:MAG: NAD(P)H-dependent oxidoreductase subunit E [Nitrospirota bacterium]